MFAVQNWNQKCGNPTQIHTINVKAHSDMSKYSDTNDQNVKLSNWDSLVKALIRPPRQDYKLSQLGAGLLNFDGTVYKHKEINVKHQTKTLELTFYQPVDCPCRYAVLYLHGNSSSRLECLTLLPGLPSSYALVSFDFLGCGLDADPFISLGVREAQQVQTVVGYLQQKEYKVILWGRSMGGASALKFGGTFITVADSPFSSMKRICQQTAVSKTPSYIPGCLVRCLFPCVFYQLRKDVKKAGDFDLNDLDIESSVRQMSPSKTVIFLVASEDSLINGSHSQRLYKAFSGAHKKIFTFAGNHNTKRPDQVLEEVFKYIQSRVKEDQEKCQMFQLSPVSDQVIISSL